MIASSKAAPQSVNRSPFLAYLMLTAMVSGALVMVIEVLGSRVIGPFFGVSLFVWTSLITVTLGALAAGYAAGGLLADRRSSADYLYGIILLAGILVLLVPVLKGMVLKACQPLGLRSGALASTLILFGPALFCLGCVSPYLVKIAAREMRNIGRTVGGFYALSTLGSVAGTLLTGFFLIAYLGVNRIFQLTGALLIALAVGYFLLVRRRWLAPVLLALPAVISAPEFSESKIMDNGTRVTVVDVRDSFYGNLKVVDYSYGQRHTRELIIDGLVQGGIDLHSGLSVYEYVYFLTLIPYEINPTGRSCLVLGLGAGVIPAWYAARGVVTDVVDIDPDVAALATQHFGFRGGGEAIIADARYFLAHTSRRYDYVILDVFNGDITPGHLLSREALALLATRINQGGVLAVNMVGSLTHKPFMTASVIETLRTAFEQVDIYPTFDSEQPRSGGNLAVIAYDGPVRELRESLLHNVSIHPLAERKVRNILRKPFRFPPDAPAIILTDDYNPIDFYDAWLKEFVRQTIVDSTDLDVLLGSE